MSIKQIKTLAFIIWIPTVISYILYSSGKLDPNYVIIINVSALILEIILFIIFIKNVLRYVDMIKNSVMVSKGKFEDKSIAANDDIFSKNIGPISPWRNGMFRIMMELAPDTEDRPLKFYIVRRYQTEIIEQKVDIIRPSDLSVHIFELNINPKELINFKFDRDATVKSFSVDELYIP